KRGQESGDGGHLTPPRCKILHSGFRRTSASGRPQSIPLHLPSPHLTLSRALAMSTLCPLCFQERKHSGHNRRVRGGGPAGAGRGPGRGGGQSACFSRARSSFTARFSACLAAFFASREPLPVPVPMIRARAIAAIQESLASGVPDCEGRTPSASVISGVRKYIESIEPENPASARPATFVGTKGSSREEP